MYSLFRIAHLLILTFDHESNLFESFILSKALKSVVVVGNTNKASSQVQSLE